MLFDIGGVLEITDGAPAVLWTRRLGLTSSGWDRLRSVLADGEIGRTTESEVFDVLASLIGRDAAESTLGEMWDQYLGHPDTVLIDYLAGLRPTYRTGLLSNSFVGAREREERRYGFSSLVDEIVYSHEVGVAKPDPAVYELACRRLDVATTETVLIDDSQVAVDGARATGMRAILHRDTWTTTHALDACLGTRYAR